MKLGGIVDSLVSFEGFEFFDLLVELGQGFFEFQYMALGDAACARSGRWGVQSDLFGHLRFQSDWFQKRSGTADCLVLLIQRSINRLRSLKPHPLIALTEGT